MKGVYFDIIAKITDKIKTGSKHNVILDFVCDKIHETVGFEKSSIVLFDGASLVIKVYRGYTPDKTIFTPEEWFTAENINPTNDCYIIDRSGLGESVSFLLRSSDEKVLGFLRGILPEGVKISNDSKEFLNTCSTILSLIIERHNLLTEKTVNENLQVIGMLRSSVVHDISNLLGVVEVYVELVEKEIADNAAVVEYMESIRSELKRANVIARDMLDFSKQKLNFHKTPFLLTDLGKDLETHCKMLSKDTGVVINFVIEKDLVMNADKDRLFRVFFNLINNAVEALGHIGQVWFKAKGMKKEIVFIVADNGKGIKKESLKRLFDPFFTSGKAKGTGLGLAVVKDIIDGHGGKLSVRSVEGKYTCFVIRIPK